ncbi:hypothetical protein O6072_18275 [Mycolicibacterium neoaurum]|nr:hypothetical protein [Mycolicibacterium neoaurum]WBP93232.1 hypothetical protein O7W24_18970 [Mycolicibacterium neoaurum]WBS06801.1 hypothetical protein O6072_18275 [Mycolicibacterium neoaurum]
MESDGRVVLFHRGFDQIKIAVRRVADVRLDAAAEVVAILATMPSSRALDDHSTNLVPLAKTPAAEETSLKVVVVSAPAFSRIATCLEQILNAVEKLLANQGFVATVESLSLVLHESEVVRVLQHGRYLRLGNRASGPRLGRSCGQTPVVEFLNDGLDSGVTVGVELECPLYEWCPVRVDGYGTDLATFATINRVEVADRRDAESAALLRFLAHLVGDVGAVFGGSVFVEGGEDAVHELADGGVVDAFGRRYEGDAAFAEVSHDDGVVDTIAG